MEVETVQGDLNNQWGKLRSTSSSPPSFLSCVSKMYPVLTILPFPSRLFLLWPHYVWLTYFSWFTFFFFFWGEGACTFTLVGQAYLPIAHFSTIFPGFLTGRQGATQLQAFAQRVNWSSDVQHPATDSFTGGNTVSTGAIRVGRESWAEALRVRPAQYSPFHRWWWPKFERDCWGARIF